MSSINYADRHSYGKILPFGSKITMFMFIVARPLLGVGYPPRMWVGRTNVVRLARWNRSIYNFLHRFVEKIEEKTHHC